MGAGGLEPPYPQNRNGFPLSAVFTADDEAAKAREQRVAADMRVAGTPFSMRILLLC